jgi:6-pyruvoyltetrahydropterin/6-carboxytetrahydropterin synthase
MYYIKRHFSFAGAHRLSKHKGLCKNIHGHNYDVWITIRSPKLNENDMVMDFSELKKHVDVIVDEFDHCLVINECDQDLIEPFKKEDMRIMVLGDYDPTAEKMTEQIYLGLKYLFIKLYNDIEVDQVEIFENVKSSAVYRED